MVEMLSRRDRVRAETTAEIKQTARKILVEQGPEAVTLRAIAREMGMTAPALYRYFGSHEELIQHVVGDIFTEIGAGIEARSTAAGGGMTEKMVAACREFRRWGLGHKAEFGMLFGTPLPTLEAAHDDLVAECAGKFSAVFFALFYELWSKQPFPIPRDDEIDPALRAAAGQVPGGARRGPAARGRADLPALLGPAVRHGQPGGVRPPALRAGGRRPMFEITLAELAQLVNLEYPPRQP